MPASVDVARWPSTLLALWPIVELASSINIPQWHLVKYTHVELVIKTNRPYKNGSKWRFSCLKLGLHSINA